MYSIRRQWDIFHQLYKIEHSVFFFRIIQIDSIVTSIVDIYLNVIWCIPNNFIRIYRSSRINYTIRSPAGLLDNPQLMVLVLVDP